jgi:hypothetical protein
MFAAGFFSAKADGEASPARIHNIPMACATLDVGKIFIGIPGKADSFAGEARCVFLRNLV